MTREEAEKLIKGAAKKLKLTGIIKSDFANYSYKEIVNQEEEDDRQLIRDKKFDTSKD